eukprot:c13324_g1_i1 orf=423-689(+)
MQPNRFDPLQPKHSNIIHKKTHRSNNKPGKIYPANATSTATEMQPKTHKQKRSIRRERGEKNRKKLTNRKWSGRRSENTIIEQRREEK